MNSLLQIKDRLWEEFNDLCEACDYEHAWLEEGPGFDQKSPAEAGPDLREAA